MLSKAILHAGPDGIGGIQLPKLDSDISVCVTPANHFGFYRRYSIDSQIRKEAVKQQTASSLYLNPDKPQPHAKTISGLLIGDELRQVVVVGSSVSN